MASFSLLLKPSVEKDLRKVPKSVVPRVWDRIAGLVENPLPRGSVKLAGTERRYRIRVGEYRIVYAVEMDAKRVIIHYVRHRREVYRGL
jgi:mRNA interferase RelE/StbE